MEWARTYLHGIWRYNIYFNFVGWQPSIKTHACKGELHACNIHAMIMAPIPFNHVTCKTHRSCVDVTVTNGQVLLLACSVGCSPPHSAWGGAGGRNVRQDTANSQSIPFLRIPLTSLVLGLSVGQGKCAFFINTHISCTHRIAFCGGGRARC